jgi:pepF/M3 family oligoendopeptidase
MSLMSNLSETHTAAAPTWDLDVLFPGGAVSDEFARFRKQVAADLASAEAEAERLSVAGPGADASEWTAFILRLQDLAARIATTRSFSGCLVSQNVDDDLGHKISGDADVFSSRLAGLLTHLESFATKQTDAEWREILGRPGISEIRFYLDEVRVRAREKMSPDRERLVSELAVNGYHAWNRLYDKMAGDLKVDLTVDDKPRSLSLGQLAMFMSSASRDLRREALRKLEEAWETRANLAAMALNAQGGFRLSVYRNRNWTDFLHEPLTLGRLERKTLEAMWSAVNDAVPRLAPYIEAKKKLLGIDRFCWYDQIAPVGGIERRYTFGEAGRFVTEQLADFSPEMAEFTAMALERRWVEAENRPGKAGGAFCTDFPTHEATRVFMTWGNEYDHLMTLAHELGHAYHGWVLRKSPYLASRYPMNLAETASTFNELRVTDAALRGAADPRERLMLLDQKLQNAFVMFCNLRARYFFDCAFYTERAAGTVPRARLDEMMVDAQRRAFGGLLADPDGFHPLFWASKLHFFITDYPFYNFPYVFGFLFANGVYDRALKEGAGFADRYRALLVDTGRMTTEEIGRRHLGVDLTERGFWDEAIGRITADVKPFVELARKSA